tara:strand:+ start:3187 stop:3855 length:669 start_codon:yes stop_codon:yes gene_type:complete
MIATLLGWGKTIVVIFQYIIAPPICYLCRCFMKQYSIICSDCDVQLIPIAPKQIKVNSVYTITIHAICRYDGPVKRFILSKNYSDHIMLTGLADLMWQKTVLSHVAIDCFIPVPLHWTRKLVRGFNQAELLANRLSSYHTAPVYTIVKRIRKTHYQARLEKSERHNNVKKAFSVISGDTITGKHVMLVDDLCTTGATAVEIAKLLVKYKPASISLVVACRAL